MGSSHGTRHPGISFIPGVLVGVDGHTVVHGKPQQLLADFGPGGGTVGHRCDGHQELHHSLPMPTRMSPGAGPRETGRGPRGWPQRRGNIHVPSPAQLTRNSWARRRCRSMWRPVASGPMRPSLGKRRESQTLAPHRDPSPGRMDSLCPFREDSDLNREAAPASDELEEAAEIL